MEMQRAAEQCVQIVPHGEIGHGEGEDERHQQSEPTQRGRQRVGGVVLQDVSEGLVSELQISADRSSEVEKEDDERGAGDDHADARHAAVLQLLVVARSVVVAVVGHADDGDHADEARAPVHDLHGLVHVVVLDELLHDHDHDSDDGQHRHHGDVAEGVDG